MDQPLVIADPDEDFRSRLRVGLEQEGNFQVVADVPNAAGALEAVAAWVPTVVILDLSMNGPVGLDLIPLIRSTAREATIIGTSHEPQLRELAIGAGVDAFIAKTSNTMQELTEVLSDHLAATANE